jgi:TPR repeat protein
MTARAGRTDRDCAFREGVCKVNDSTENKENQDRIQLPEMNDILLHLPVNLKKMSIEEKVALGYALEKGKGYWEQDYKMAAAVYASAAADGDPTGMNNLGWLYLNGYGVEKDQEKAEDYFQKAANLGQTAAMVNLGNIAEDAQEYEAAYIWYRRAYMMGDPAGQFNYANMYNWGWYVEQDYGFAFRNFLELAGDGYLDAIFYVGHYLQEGLGVNKDEEAAFHWFERGEELEDPSCTTELGRCYGLGLGVEKDEKKGLEYYLKGTERGDALAYANVGYCYESGQGTAKNMRLARKYYKEGAELGEEHCLEAMKRLRKRKKKTD